MNLDHLLAPRSIAIVGASPRPSIGMTIIESLRLLEFDGAVYPVNPKYESVLGHDCYADLDAVPGPVDLVAFCIGPNRILAGVEAAARKQAGAAVIYGGGFAETGEEGRALQAGIETICREASITLCGPNCMGVINPHHRSHAYMMRVTDPAAFRGNVGLISQSGSVSIGMIADTRRYGFSHVISSGNEAVTSAAAYLEYLIDDPHTRVIALFSETINEPQRFVAALDRARDANKPVVMLKVGKSDRAAVAIQTHTGGLAGSARTFSALLRAHHAIEVSDLEEMSEVLAACQAERWPTGERMAVVTSSGGHAELVLDIATREGLQLPALRADVRAEIESTVGRLTGDGNPVDAWGEGDYETNYPCALAAVAQAKQHDAVLVIVDSIEAQPTEETHFEQFCIDLLQETARSCGIPLYLLSTRHGVFHRKHAAALRRASMSMLSGIAQGLGAVTRLARFCAPDSDCPARPPDARATSLEPEIGRVTIHEYDAKRLLASTGLPVTREHVVDDINAAGAAATDIGFPLALKVVSDDIPHRTDRGLVEINLRNNEELAAAWGRIQSRLNPGEQARFTVQEMAAPGVEVIAGVKRDPDFGLFLAVGPGGVLAELFDDVALCALPARSGDLERMVDETALGDMLGGVRGAEPADRAALVNTLQALANFATSNAAFVEGIDINPIIVYPHGCIAVDALIVPRNHGKETIVYSRLKPLPRTATPSRRGLPFRHR